MARLQELSNENNKLQQDIMDLAQVSKKDGFWKSFWRRLSRKEQKDLKSVEERSLASLIEINTLNDRLKEIKDEQDRLLSDIPNIVSWELAFLGNNLFNINGLRKFYQGIKIDKDMK